MSARAAASAPMMWAQALALGFCVAWAPAPTVLGVVLLLPGIAAWYLDRSHGRPVGRAVLTFGLAGALAPMWHQLQHDSTMRAMLADAVDLRAIGLAWGLAGAGWLIGSAAQLVVAIHRRSEMKNRIRQLTAHRKALEAEWDLGPR